MNKNFTCHLYLTDDSDFITGNTQNEIENLLAQKIAAYNQRGISPTSSVIRETCATCKGTGKVSRKICPDCEGARFTRLERREY